MGKGTGILEIRTDNHIESKYKLGTSQKNFRSWRAPKSSDINLGHKTDHSGITWGLAQETEQNIHPKPIESMTY